MMKSTLQPLVLKVLFLLAVLVRTGGAALSERQIIEKEIEWMKKSMQYYQHGFSEKIVLSRDVFVAASGDRDHPLFQIPEAARTETTTTTTTSTAAQQAVPARGRLRGTIDGRLFRHNNIRD
jgi:hypothetical protein